MRKTMLIALTLFFTLIFTFAAADLSITRCMYYTDERPCDIIWWADTQTRQHCRACRNHVTDKEDPRSYVPVTEWASCSVGESGACAVCGADYRSSAESDPTADEKMLMELFMVHTMDHGAAPLTTSVSGSELKLSLTPDFVSWVYDMGGYVSETLMVKTEYALSLPAGSTYAYEGSPVTPAAEVIASEYGPGALLEQFGMLTIGDPYYENNQTPGKAKALVDLSVKRGQTYTLAVSFTIEGEEPERVPGDSDGDGVIGMADAITLLNYCADPTESIRTDNADLDGDGAATLEDLLSLLKYLAGWDISFE